MALSRDGAVFGERELPATGRRHARMLVSDLQTLLREHGVPARQLDAVAVSVGPGSFTGLRVGLVCAKTLAYGIGCPLLAVDTFLAIASRVPDHVHELAIFDDALRGEIFAGIYQRKTEVWESAEAPTLIDAETWLEHAAGRSGLLVTGPGLVKWNETFRDRVQLLPEDLWMPQASAVALLGEQQLLSGEAANVNLLEPFYIRRSAAEEQAERAATSRGA